MVFQSGRKYREIGSVVEMPFVDSSTMLGVREYRIAADLQRRAVEAMAYWAIVSDIVADSIGCRVAPMGVDTADCQHPQVSLLADRSFLDEQGDVAASGWRDARERLRTADQHAEYWLHFIRESVGNGFRQVR